MFNKLILISVTSVIVVMSACSPCREYTIDAQIGNQTEQIYGTACRQPDGSWQVQN